MENDGLDPFLSLKNEAKRHNADISHPCTGCGKRFVNELSRRLKNIISMFCFSFGVGSLFDNRRCGVKATSLRKVRPLLQSLTKVSS